MSTREFRLTMGACLLVGLAALLWSWSHGVLLIYGDAMAHLHIARRILDSRRPGITQLGSVWLPLPHLLLMPFAANFWMWATGWAAAVPGVLSYLAGCAGLYRLMRRWLATREALFGLAFFALNLNLLYLQTTAMSEPLFLAEMIWTACWLVEWREALDRDLKLADRLEGCIAVALIAAVYTRYDGWVMTFVVWVAMGIELLRRGRLRRKAYWIASTAVVAAPLLWFVYNQLGFGDWLFFARGPYSALAIEERTAVHGHGALHPGWHNPWISIRYFVKCAEMDAVINQLSRWLLPAALLTTLWGWCLERKRAFNWSLILWFPLPFYGYSVSWGSVPIFIPVWWPHSWYNTRYGLELLPAFALAAGFGAQILLVWCRQFKPRWQNPAALVLAALLLANIVVMARQHPLTFVEGQKNLAARKAYEENISPAIAAALANKPGAPVLMETSTYPELVALAGIPLRQTINESDKYFYWDALAAPATHAALVLAFDGDEIDRAVKAHPEGLRPLRRFSLKGQPSGTLYVSELWAKNSSLQSLSAVVASGRGA